MFFVAVPAWIVYSLAIWAVLWGIALLWLAWAVIRYVQSRVIYVEDEKEPAQEKPSNLIMLHSDETGY